MVETGSGCLRSAFTACGQELRSQVPVKCLVQTLQLCSEEQQELVPN